MKGRVVQRTKGSWSIIYDLPRGPEGKLTLESPKTEKGLRSIPLPSFVVEALVQHRISQRTHKEQLGARLP